MMPSLPVWWSAEAPASAAGINMIQFNLSFRNPRPKAVADFIRAADADIVTLQEVTDKTVKVLELLAKDYPTRIRCRYARVGSVAVLSRLPAAKGKAQGCVDGQGMTWIRVVAGGQELTVASVHLHWPWPFQQYRQIGELERYLRELPRPVLLAGDFNAAPWSHAVDRIAKASGASVAPGLRFSFDIEFNDWAPPLPIPIDHILLPGDVTPLDVRLGPELGSDHRPIVARLALPLGAMKKLAAHN
jgi:endonuclease/exonuclease/phosphatase (EEP) superfamily protein YafD